MALSRASVFRTVVASGARAGSRVSSHWRQFGRRTYTSDAAGHGPTPKKSDLPWAIASVAITVPAAALLLNSGPEKKPHGHIGEEHHSIEEVKKAEEELKPKEPQPEEPKPEELKEVEPKPEEEPKEEVIDVSPRVHEYDRVRQRDPDVDVTLGTKQVGGPNVASSRQEGIANADTSNPFLSDKGKSEKSEGTTETARLRGSVHPDRPQH
ncbi:hypothetical protein M432DRAFT_636336 [Thermoascus aurantiacus ATCC 26904]